MAINDLYNINLASTTVTLEWDPPGTYYRPNVESLTGGSHSKVIVVLAKCTLYGLFIAKVGYSRVSAEFPPSLVKVVVLR